MYNKFFTIKTKIISKFNLLTSYLPFQVKAKILLPTLMVAAIAVPVSIFAISNLTQPDSSRALDDTTAQESLDKHEQEIQKQHEQEEQGRLDQHNQELLALGLDPNYKSPNAMPEPFVDQNFYNCVELEFKKEFPDETIDPSGLTDTQLAKITNLICDSSGKPDTEKISDATGLEKLTALTYLDVDNNQLTSLDVSQNIVLSKLYTSANQLTSLNVSQNLVLTDLYAGHNKLATLDTSNNTILSKLWVDYNQLTSLSIAEENTSLISLSASDNQLRTLDIPHNTTLQEVRVASNKLTSIDVSQSPALTDLYAHNNEFQSINVSGDVALTDLYAANNQLESIDVSDNVALRGLYISSNKLHSLDISNNAALTELYVSGNQLHSLDVSSATALTYLQISRNQLTSLNTSANTLLTDLYAEGNQLTSLDLSKNTALTRIEIPSNHLTLLDVSHNTALTYLAVSNNQLTSLDLSKNIALTSLTTGGNYLTSLDLRHNPEIDYLRADDIMLKTDIVSQQVESNRNFDLTNIKFIGDFLPSSYKNTIPDTENYTFNDDTRILSVNNLAGANGYAQIAAVSGDHATYKLQLPKIYKIHYNLNGGTSGAIGDTECESMDGFCNAQITEAEPTRSGYKFLGWADSSSSTTGDYHKGGTYKIADPDTEKTLYAIWAPAHTLNFDANHGTGAPSPQTCYPDTTIGACTIKISSTTPERDGYYFAGWADSETATTGQYRPGGNITLASTSKTIYAVWSEAPVLTTYTLHYDANGGAGVPEDQTQQTSENQVTWEVTTTVPLKPGYTFLGWSTDQAATVAQYHKGETFTTSDVKTILYAVWEQAGPGPTPTPTGALSWKHGRDHVKGSKDNAVFNIDYPLSDFKELKLNDKTLEKDKDFTIITPAQMASSDNANNNSKNSSYFSVNDNPTSTTITIKGEYLDTLNPNTYNIVASFSQDDINTTINIIKSDSPTPVPVPGTSGDTGTPNTGEGEHQANPAIVTLCILIPLLAAALTFVSYKIFKPKHKSPLEYYTYKG